LHHSVLAVVVAFVQMLQCWYLQSADVVTMLLPSTGAKRL